MPEFQKFKIDANRLLPILQRDLYKHSTTMLRELAQNAMDSITRRSAFQSSFDPKRDGRIIFRYDAEAKSIIVSDNGCGMSKRLLLDVFRFYGRSDKDGGELGCRGLGAKSIFSWADAFNIQTKSVETEENLNVYVTLEGLSFLDNPPDKDDYGTTFSIPSEKLFTIQDLQEFCRCVEIPVYSILDEKEQLVSQRLPLDGPVAVIHGEGFDIYIDGDPQNYARASLYCGGIFVTHHAELGFYHIAVNVKHKDLIDLTIGRDDPIENEKWKTFKGNVTKTMKQTLAQISLTPKFVRSEHGYALCKWIYSEDRNGTGLPETEMRPFQGLMSKVRAVVVRNECGRVGIRIVGEGYNGPRLLDVVRPEGKQGDIYYSWKTLSNVRATVENRLSSLRQGTSVIYWSALKKDRFRYWVKIFGIEEFDVESLISRKKALWVKGKLRSTEVEDLESLEVPLVVFPTGIDQKVVKDASEYLDCAIMKLHPKIKLPTTSRPIDLRGVHMMPRVWFRGERTTQNASGAKSRGIRVAPLFLEKFTDLIGDNVFVPTDLASAAYLIREGVQMLADDEVKKTLLKRLPEELHEVVNDYIYGLSNLKVLAKVVSDLDWNNPYSKAVFYYSVMELAGDYGWSSIRYRFSPCDTIFGERGVSK